MELKYFRYISKTKVDMLYDQVTSQKSGFFQFSPKISLPGFQIELGLRGDAEQSDRLIKRTAKLLKILHKRKLLESLSGGKELLLDKLYKDSGAWHTGLYKWIVQEEAEEKPESFSEILAYFAFRTLDDSLLLLIGSPTHVMGGTGINEQRTIYYDSTEYMYDIHLRNRVGRVVNADDKSSRLPRLLSDDDEYTLNLGVFCLGTLTRLPLTQTETVFKLYEYRKLEKSLEEVVYLEAARDLGVFSFEGIYVGSPLYTART